MVRAAHAGTTTTFAGLSGGVRRRIRHLIANRSTCHSAHASCVGAKGGLKMRRRLERFFPIVMLALLVQLLAPVASCWATVHAASDPFAAAICAHDSSGAPRDARGDPSHMLHHGCCGLCGMAHAATPAIDPQSAFSQAERPLTSVVWREAAASRPPVRGASNAQARGPPIHS